MSHHILLEINNTLWNIQEKIMPNMDGCLEVEDDVFIKERK
jgi:hypothetical protein